MAALSDWLQNVHWPKAPKELRDPVGHTAFSSNDLRDAWLACARLNWDGQQKQLRDDCDKCFRVDNYGNVISIFARINSPCATAYDHFFPFSRGGRTRSVPGATHTNIIMIQVQNPTASHTFVACRICAFVVCNSGRRIRSRVTRSSSCCSRQS
jgi:hypothetical protein